MQGSDRQPHATATGRRKAAVFRRLAICAAVFLTPGVVTGAASFESLARIAQVAEDTVSSRLPEPVHSREVRAEALDPRLRLAACETPLEGELAAGFARSRRPTVIVRCTSGRPWKVFVPVSVSERDEVLVAASSLPRGAVLAASDVSVAMRSLDGLDRGYLRPGDPVAGMRLRRGVSAGQVLTPALVEARSVIRRGQRITLVAAGEGLKVAMEGVALGDGAIGQRIKVRNMSSQRELEGVVRSRQRVEILLR